MQNELLIRVLAAVDAIFVPIRKFNEETHPLALKRLGYPGAGIDVRRPGKGMGQNSFERTRLDLSGRGLIHLLGKIKGKGIKLTGPGDTLARSLCGLPTLIDAWPLVRQLWDLRNDPEGTDDGGFAGAGAWTRETKLAKLAEREEGKPRELVFQEEEFLPLLTRGLAKSAADTHGRVWYCLTAAGNAIAEGGESEDDSDPAEEDPECRALYYAEIKAALLDKSDAGSSREIWTPLMSASPYLRGIKSSPTSDK